MEGLTSGWGKLNANSAHSLSAYSVSQVRFALLPCGIQEMMLGYIRTPDTFWNNSRYPSRNERGQLFSKSRRKFCTMHPGLLLQSTPRIPKGYDTELSGLRTEHIQFSSSDCFHLQNLKTNTALLMPRIQTLVPSASPSVTWSTPIQNWKQPQEGWECCERPGVEGSC